MLRDHVAKNAIFSHEADANLQVPYGHEELTDTRTTLVRSTMVYEPANGDMLQIATGTATRVVTTTQAHPGDITGVSVGNDSCK